MRNKQFWFYLDFCEIIIYATDILSAISKFRKLFGDLLLEQVYKII